MKPEQDSAFYKGPPFFQRTYWKKEIDVAVYDTPEYRVQSAPSEANIVSSLLRNGLHAPALDIDLPCRLVPSSTEGHFHLYIDKPMSWRAYKRVLRALCRAGIIEKGYYRASVARRATDLRLYQDKPSFEG